MSTSRVRPGGTPSQHSQQQRGEQDRHARAADEGRLEGALMLPTCAPHCMCVLHCTTAAAVAKELAARRAWWSGSRRRLPRRLQQPLPRACGLPSERTCCSSSSLPLPRSSWALILAAAWTCRAGQRCGGVHGAPPAPAACWWGCAAPGAPASTPPIGAPRRAASPRTHRAGNLDDGQIHVQRGRCRRAGALGGRPARPQQPGQCSAPLLPGCRPDDH